MARSLAIVFLPLLTGGGRASLVPALTGFAPLALKRRLHGAAVAISVTNAFKDPENLSSLVEPHQRALKILPPFDADTFKFARDSRVPSTSYANWLVVGRLMVGRYPGVEPSRCSSAACAEEHIESLVSAGVVTWVGFQAEIPSQMASPHTALVPAVRAAPLNQIAAPMSVEVPPVASSSATEVSSDSAATNGALKGEAEHYHEPPSWVSVSAEEWRSHNGSVEPNAFFEGGRCGDFGAYGPTAARIAAKLRRPAPRFLHFPIMDLQAPTLAALKDMAAAVLGAIRRHEAEQDGGVVYLHCWGGKGRSGTVGAAVLAMLYPDSSEEDILAHLKQSFLTRELPGDTPETDDQRAVISAFIKQLRADPLQLAIAQPAAEDRRRQQLE